MLGSCASPRWFVRCRLPPANPFPKDKVAVALGGRYTIHEELRVGGQGVVYRAIRTKAQDGSAANDSVALKLHTDPGQDLRVEREISAMERLRHPNLANLIEHARVTIVGRNVRYVAWEFIQGEALDHRLQTGPLPPKTVACLGRDVARAIEHIWSARIVHRDVNPKNIMLRVGDREAVLIDLGVARHLDERTITTKGATWGTMGYLSPEQCHAEPQLTCQSDVYCLGIVLQQSLCARHPTNGDQAALIAKPPRTVDLVAATPAALADLIDGMFHPRAAFRPAPAAIAEKLAELADRL
ncbi:MAG: serine/threonine protein kinase [Gemmatimonadetes bacterium]|nr:MAG: hypothetical protein DMD67_18465 [Gemmatimonadota bacterium]TLY46050.1 MAG: serine/threonine protein kinase [Gemmatimonadota bacterium]